MSMRKARKRHEAMHRWLKTQARLVGGWHLMQPVTAAENKDWEYLHRAIRAKQIRFVSIHRRIVRRALRYATH